MHHPIRLKCIIKGPVFLKFKVELIHELIQKKAESESNRFNLKRDESEFLIDSNVSY